MRVLFALFACALMIAVGMQAPGAKVESVAGTWTGTADYTAPSGENQSGGAWCIFKQDGGTVTGTAGPDEMQQVPVLDGRFADGKLTFRIEVSGDSVQAVYKIELKVVSPDRMEGTLAADIPNVGKVTGKLLLTKKA